MERGLDNVMEKLRKILKCGHATHPIQVARFPFAFFLTHRYSNPDASMWIDVAQFKKECYVSGTIHESSLPVDFPIVAPAPSKILIYLARHASDLLTFISEMEDTCRFLDYYGRECLLTKPPAWMELEEPGD